MLLSNKEGNRLPNYRKGGGVWGFLSSAFFTVVPSGKNPAASQGVSPNTLQVTFLPANQESRQLTSIDGSRYTLLDHKLLLLQTLRPESRLIILKEEMCSHLLAGAFLGHAWHSEEQENELPLAFWERTVF